MTDEELVRAKIATLQGEAARGRSSAWSGVPSSAAKKQDKKLTTKDYENMMDDFAFPSDNGRYAKNSRINAEEELTSAVEGHDDLSTSARPADA